MTREEAKSCIGTIELLQRLAYNIHGVMDVIDADNCKKIIKALEQEPCNDIPTITIPVEDYIKLIEQESILDKISTEMEQIKEAEYQIYGKGSWRFVDKCLDVIDKYKGESEEE